MFDSSSPVFVLAGWGIGTLPEVESTVRCLAKETCARDGALPEPTADRVDRLRQAVGAVRRVEQRELLSVREVDGGEADEPDASPGHERPAEQRQGRVV